MPCYNPLRAFVGPVVTPGKVNVVWKEKDSAEGEKLYLPCGQCIGCRLERSCQWAMRCIHEASLYDRNCFITLTYDDEHLPVDGSLCLDEFQGFMKRLRKKYSCKCKVGRRKTCKVHGVRFFHCGEYGEKLGRPHYHAILFNHDFDDKVLWKVRNGHRVYISESLRELWTFGNHEIGSVSFESAAYVARYVLKKVNDSSKPDIHDKYEAHYQGKRPEYVTMSRRPGIGSGWFSVYGKEVYPSDEVIVNGFPRKPPRYYDNILSVKDRELYDLLKADRKSKGSKMVVKRCTVMIDGKFVEKDILISNDSPERLS